MKKGKHHMSTNALKAAVTGQVAQRTERPTTLAGLMADPKIKAQMALALPKHMTADRLARIALTEIRKVPKLAQCDQTSFLGAIMQCAQLGLEPGGALGHAYLIPFENRRKGITEVQFIVGYRGMLDLARRSGQIMSIEARAVYETDRFHVAFGLNPDLQHEPNWDAADRGDLKFVYAVAKLKDGGSQFDVMSRADIERVRDASQGYQTARRFAKDGVINSPWATHFEEMAKKTILRRLFKYLPISIELQQAVSNDERADVGLPQDTPLTIDADTGEITGGEHDEQPPDAELVRESLTYAQVADLINKADSPIALDMARDSIPAVADEKQQAELNQLASKRLAELQKGGAQ